MSWSPHAWCEALASLRDYSKPVTQFEALRLAEREFWERAFLCAEGAGSESYDDSCQVADHAADEWRKRWGAEGSRR